MKLTQFIYILIFRVINTHVLNLIYRCFVLNNYYFHYYLSFSTPLPTNTSPQIVFRSVVLFITYYIFHKLSLLLAGIFNILLQGHPSLQYFQISIHLKVTSSLWIQLYVSLLYYPSIISSLLYVQKYN